jgi:hypothetical protein
MLTNIDPIDVYPKSLLDHELPDFLNKETIHIDENHLENWEGVAKLINIQK